METIIVLKPGQKVKINEEIPGVINRVSINRNNHVVYEVIWWDGRQRCAEWFVAQDFIVTQKEETKIGFAI